MSADINQSFREFVERAHIAGITLPPAQAGVYLNNLVARDEQLHLSFAMRPILPSRGVSRQERRAAARKAERDKKRRV